MNNSIKGVCIASVLILSATAQCGKMLDFSLCDSYGREVSWQDYAGVPIFLEFGACW